MIDTEVKELEKQRAARLAAEALFEPIAQPRQAHPATVVSVRHRRVANVGAASTTVDVPVVVDQPTAPVPKVHLIAPAPALNND